MRDSEFLVVMLSKLIEALERKDTERDGNWGYMPFREEIAEMRAELERHPAVIKARRELRGR